MVTPYDGARAFRRAMPAIEDAGRARQIGSREVLDDIQAGIRGFGMGVEALWNATQKGAKVPGEAVHNLLINLKNLAVFEGAARVAHQRSGYMDIPREQRDNLRDAYNNAERGADLLERLDRKAA